MYMYGRICRYVKIKDTIHISTSIFLPLSISMNIYVRLSGLFPHLSVVAHASRIHVRFMRFMRFMIDAIDSPQRGGTCIEDGGEGIAGEEAAAVQIQRADWDGIWQSAALCSEDSRI